MPSPDREPTSGKLSRRDFLKAAGGAALGILAGCAPEPVASRPTIPPTVPARKTPEPTAIPVTTPKRVEATPTSEVEEVEIGGLRGVVVEGSFGSVPSQSEEFARILDLSPFKLTVTYEDGVIAGYNTNKSGEMLVFAGWDAEKQRWLSYATKEPLDVRQAKSGGANIRTVEVDKSGRKTISDKPIETLAAEERVVVLPGVAPFSAIIGKEEPGKKKSSYEWLTVLKRDLGEGKGIDLSGQPEEIEKALTVVVAKSTVEKVVQEAQKPVANAEGTEKWFGGFELAIPGAEIVDRENGPRTLLTAFADAFASQKGITSEQLREQLNKNQKMRIVLPQDDPNSSRPASLIAPKEVEVDLAAGVKITTGTEPSPNGTKLRLGVTSGSVNYKDVWISWGVGERQQLIFTVSGKFFDSVVGQQNPDRSGVFLGSMLSTALQAVANMDILKGQPESVKFPEHKLSLEENVFFIRCAVLAGAGKINKLGFTPVSDSENPFYRYSNNGKDLVYTLFTVK